VGGGAVSTTHKTPYLLRVPVDIVFSGQVLDCQPGLQLPIVAHPEADAAFPCGYTSHFPSSSTGMRVKDPPSEVPNTRKT
jgi:hypothetical protein